MEKRRHSLYDSRFYIGFQVTGALWLVTEGMELVGACSYLPEQMLDVAMRVKKDLVSKYQKPTIFYNKHRGEGEKRFMGALLKIQPDCANSQPGTPRRTPEVYCVSYVCSRMSQDFRRIALLSTDW